MKALFERIPITVKSKKGGLAKEINKLSAALTNSREKGVFWRRLLPGDYNKEVVNREVLKDSFYKNIFENG